MFRWVPVAMLRPLPGTSSQTQPDGRSVGSVEKVGVRALAAPVSDIRNQLIS